MIKKKRNKVLVLLLFMFGLLPILPNKIKGIPIVLMFIFSLYILIKTKNKVKFPTRNFLFISSLYLVFLPSIIYTENLARIDKYLSARLALLLTPLIFSFLFMGKMFINDKIVKKVTFSFIIGGTIYAILILTYLFYLGLFSEEIYLNDAMNYLNKDMYGINQHPIYASMFLAVPLLFILEKIISIKQKKRELICLLFSFLIIVSALIILARKGVLLALFIVFLFMFFYSLKNIKVKIISIVIILIMPFFLWKVPPIKSRFSELFRKSTYLKYDPNNSTSVRVAIYDCCFIKIKEAPVLGYGLGDVENELKKCYKENNSFVSAEEYYNSHNQYFSYYLTSGILGLLTILYFLMRLFYDGIKNKKVILMALVLFFSIIMLSENILERQSGLTLFSFLMTFFSFYEKNKKIGV